MSHTDTMRAAIHNSGGLTDSEMVRRTGVEPHQQVNQICRRLAREGRIIREIGPHGNLVNRPLGLSWNGHNASRVTEAPAIQAAPPAARTQRAGLVDLKDLDVGRTLFVPPCSGSKVRGGNDHPDSGPA